MQFFKTLLVRIWRTECAIDTHRSVCVHWHQKPLLKDSIFYYFVFHYDKKTRSHVNIVMCKARYKNLQMHTLYFSTWWETKLSPVETRRCDLNFIIEGFYHIKVTACIWMYMYVTCICALNTAVPQAQSVITFLIKGFSRHLWCVA